MKKEQHNDPSSGGKDQKKPSEKTMEKKAERIQKRDVDHGDIEYDPSDPHGLTIKETVKEKKK